MPDLPVDDDQKEKGQAGSEPVVPSVRANYQLSNGFVEDWERLRIYFGLRRLIS